MDSFDQRSNKSGKPFEKYSFFLDSKNPPQLNASLREKIIQLGGKVDIFLTRNTSCFVTSRSKNEIANPNSETDSPTPKLILNSNAAFSRAKMLLEKSTQAFKTTDTLELARNLNVRILRSSKLLKFWDVHHENINAKSSSTFQDDSSRKLNPPFIKVVDNSFKYRPNYKELVEWPELNFEYQPELCPFFKKPIKFTTPVNNPNQQVNSISQQSNKSTVPTACRQLNEKCTMLTTPILTTGTAATPIVQGNANKSNATTVNQKNPTKKKHMTYCEICHKDYSDFEAHLNDEKHDKFLKDNENFNEINGVINSLPPFLNQSIISMTCLLNNSKNNSAIFSDFTNVSVEEWSSDSKKIRSGSPPPMTAIHSLNHLTSSSKKASFVALHTWNMPDNENVDKNEHSSKEQNEIMKST